MPFPKNSIVKDGPRGGADWHERALAIFEGKGMGLIVVDRDSRISYANFAAEDYLDMLPGSLAGLRINELPVNIRATLLLCYYRALRDDVPDRFEENIRYDKRLGFNVYPDEQGMVITVEDVTREWRAGEVARISTLTIDSLPDARGLARARHADSGYDFSGRGPE
jgi:PAS domain-containing protein